MIVLHRAVLIRSLGMLEVLVESVEVRVPLKLWPCANMGLLAMRRVVCV